MAKQPDLHFAITATNDDLRRKLAESRQEIIESGKTAEAQASRIDGSFRRMAISAAAGFSAISFGKSIVRVRGEMQMMEQSFDVLLGSKAKATQMIAQIKQLAIDSPLEMPQVSGAVQTLLGFGVEAEKVMGIVGQLSDVSMGNADRFRSLALVYAQTQSAGKLMGQDLLQMINAGFNPLQVIADKTGKSIGALKEEMSKGAISAEMVAEAFATVTSEGGKFYQMTQKQADGIIGLQATFEDAITNQLNKLGREYEGLIEGGYRFATSVVENADAIVAALLPIIATYGTYKASIIAINAIGKVRESSFAAVEIAELSKLLPVKQASANADIAQAVAKGHLSQATAERLLAVRAEVQAELEGLRIKAQTLATEAVAAAQAHKSALQRSVAARQNMALAQAQMQIAIQGGSAEEIAAAKTAARTAKLEVNSSAIAVNTTRQALGTAQSQSSAAATVVDTMQTNLNTVATRSATTAKTLWTAATMRLTKAFHSLKLAFASNPIGMILTGVTMALSLFSMFGGKARDAEESIRGVEKASKSASEEFDAQRAKVEALQSVMNNSKVAYDERKRALNELKVLIPQYNGELDKEGKIINNNTTAIKLYLTQLERQIKMKAAQEELEEAYRNKRIKERELKEKEASLLVQEEQNRNYKTPVGASQFATAYGNTSGQQAAGNTRDRIEVIKKELSGLTKDVEELNNEIAETSAPVDGVVTSVKTFTEQLSASATSVKNLSKEITDIRSGAYQLKPGEDVAKLLEDKTKELKEAQSKYDLLSGIDSKAAAKDYSAEVIDVMLKGEQLKLDVMRDGRAKELAQIEQTKKEKLAAIDKEQKEVAAKLGSQGKKLTKDDLSAFGEQRTNIGLIATNDTTAVNKKYDDEIAEDWKALTAVFLSEEQKRGIAIEERYSKERKRLDERLKGGSIDQATYAKFSMQVDASEAKEQLDALTANYQTYTDQRKAIEDKFNADLAALQAKNKDGKLDGNIAEVEKQKKAALSKVKVDEASAGLDFTKLFGNLDNLTLPAAKELRDKIKAWIDEAGNSLAPEDLRAVSDAFQKLEIKIADKDPFAILKSSIGELKTANEDIVASQDKVAKSQIAAQSASNILAVAQQRVTAAQKEYNEALKSNDPLKILSAQAKLYAAQNDLNNANAKGVATAKKLTEATEAYNAALDKRAAAVAKANEAIGSIADKGQQIVGAAQDVLGIMSDLGVKVPENIANALGGIGQIMDGLGSIDITQPLSIVTGAVKMLGGLVKTVASLFNGDNKREAEIERLQGKIDMLSSSYDKLQKAAEKAYSTDAGKLLDQSNELIEKQKALILLQIAEEEAKKDTDSGKIDAWKKQIDELDQKASENVEKKVDLVLGSDWKSDVDSFVSGYMDSFGVIGQGAKEMADQMKKNIIKGLLSKDIGAAVESARKKMEGLVADGDLSEADMAEIDTMSAEITKMMDQRGKMYEGLLGKDENADTDTREASKRGIATASQESVDENNGRLTAIQGHTYELNEGIKGMIPNIGSIRESMDFVKNNAAQQLDALHKIRDNTAPIAAMQTEIKGMHSTLEDIKINGLVLRK